MERVKVFLNDRFDHDFQMENSRGKSFSNWSVQECFTTGFRRFSLLLLFYLSSPRGGEKEKRHLKVFTLLYFIFPRRETLNEKNWKRGMNYDAWYRREIDGTSGECLVSRDSLQFGYFWIAGLITSRCVLMKLASCSLSCLDPRANCRNRMFHGW